MATIALVDDDKNILASVTMLLEQEGYHVRSYTDGASALTALTATPPDLVIRFSINRRRNRRRPWGGRGRASRARASNRRARRCAQGP